MVLSPGVGSALQNLGAAGRYSTGFTTRGREIAILLTAHHWSSSFEIYAHEATARQAGLSDSELAALGERRVEAFPDDERVLGVTVCALLDRGDLDDDEFAAAKALLGDAGIVELTTLVGYYATLALQLRVLGIDTPQ